MIQVFPQIMGQTRRAALAVGFAFAQRGVQFVFGGGDDLGNVDFARVAPPPGPRMLSTKPALRSLLNNCSR